MPARTWLSRPVPVRMSVYLAVREPGPEPDPQRLAEACGELAGELSIATDVRMLPGTFAQRELWRSCLPLGLDAANRKRADRARPGRVLDRDRLDIWWQAARHLNVSKTPVRIELAPATGTGSLLGQTATPTPSGTAGEGRLSPAVAEGPLPLVAGTRTQILPDGLAAAGRDAPAAVKAMVAAGNRLYGTGYLHGGGHGVPLSQLQPAYDCSSAVSYLLYAAWVLGSEYAEDSTQLSGGG